MYAIVTNVRVENPDEVRLLLPEAREALVSHAPGIVCGYWLEPIEGVGTSVLVFETKQHAEDAAKYPVPPMLGATLLDLTIREVLRTSEERRPCVTTSDLPRPLHLRHHSRQCRG
jgi:hypothetical protein